MSADRSRGLVELETREPGRGGVLVEMEAAPVLSYLGRVLDGTLTSYVLPPAPFTPGTNGVGVVRTVGPGVHHVAPGDRVILDPRLVADERVREPAQILIGLTAMGATAATRALQADWPDGTFAERARMPASVATVLPRALDRIPGERLIGLSKLAVPFGGFVRAGLVAGETVVVNGASGYFGSAAVLLALALGAARVVAAGRDRTALAELAAALGPRVAPVALSGDADASALVDAAGGRADLALDLVGRATDAAATVATLHALRRGGRLVLMGSMSAPLPLAVGEMLANDWHVMGCFMYPADVPARLAGLVASGQVDLGALRVRAFPLAELEAALAAAARMRGLDVTALVMKR